MTELIYPTLTIILPIFYYFTRKTNNTRVMQIQSLTLWMTVLFQTFLQITERPEFLVFSILSFAIFLISSVISVFRTLL